MEFKFHHGTAFLLPHNISAIEHLWIVLTEPSPIKNEVIIVNVTSLRSYSDKTVILNEGDHPFIHHPSVIS
ncbi:MAG: hypothetical protein AABZ60_20805 [Planctomycetota bacterium]